MANKKYSVDFAEGYLAGIGVVHEDTTTGTPRSFNKIIDDIYEVGAEGDYDMGLTALKYVCSKEFLEKHPME
jgi:hypothetical protein